jgi:hypothetical protein
MGRHDRPLRLACAVSQGRYRNLFPASCFCPFLHGCRVRRLVVVQEFSPPVAVVVIPTLFQIGVTSARCIFGRSRWIELFVFVIVRRATASRKAHDRKSGQQQRESSHRHGLLLSLRPAVKYSHRLTVRHLLVGPKTSSKRRGNNPAAARIAGRRRQCRCRCG